MSREDNSDDEWDSNTLKMSSKQADEVWVGAIEGLTLQSEESMRSQLTANMLCASIYTK